MFAELKMDLSERGGTHQQSEVAHLNAKVINVEEGATHYVVSVQFSGFIKDATGAGDESFDEVWHFEKPVQGAGGWGLSGIQQAV